MQKQLNPWQGLILFVSFHQFTCLSCATHDWQTDFNINIRKYIKLIPSRSSGIVSNTRVYCKYCNTSSAILTKYSRAGIWRCAAAARYCCAVSPHSWQETAHPSPRLTQPLHMPSFDLVARPQLEGCPQGGGCLISLKFGTWGGSKWLNTPDPACVYLLPFMWYFTGCDKEYVMHV